MTWHIKAEWDDEAAVWVATSDDVPGLATEAATKEALVQKLKVMVPELLALNMNLPADGEMIIQFIETRPFALAV